MSNKTNKTNKTNKQGAPDAPPVVNGAPDAPPVVNGAPENEAEQAARQAAIEKATAENNKAASKIAADWAKADKSAKQWMVGIGARCHAYLASECAIDTPYSVALGQLAKWTLQTTGESKSADITRCIKLYFASLVFGEGFARLSIRGQKELATFLEATNDEKSKATVYVLTPKTADMAKKIVAVCTGAVKELPEGIERLKDGAVSGDVIAEWVRIAKLGRDPLTESKDDKKAAQEKAKAEREAKEGAKPPAGGQGGKGEEETASAVPNVKPTLNVKPALAGGELVSLLTEHEAAPVVLHSAGKAKEMTAEMVESIIMGMAEVGRIADLRHIANVLQRELRIAVTMEAGKCGRQDAIAKIEALDAKHQRAA